MPEPLEVDLIELRMFADRLESHGSEFASGHQKAHAGASQVALGSGLAAAALPEMLTAWESDGARFGKHYNSHAQHHREATSGYERTDTSSSTRIRNVAPGL
ncbi:ESX-1 secretion-associated protein [Mycobacteroides abscessus]|uniref:ESX-1 secretion-associated protein n=1 Tax=Mycobacteroides abscessus TaxID=36809 RepID=UPI000C25DCA6|nr:ESX-1 secretion-associated protein [Mycobacteroides abscessus]RIT31395.1 ESX-1 secretion-associated protein [Mycobacteroides abscessus]RIT32431.1 ESX-1 secretion-associated protein [Mycobacteroides abscessus]